MPDAGLERAPAPARKRDSEATRRAILEAAFIEFTDHGLSGARVDAIVARCGSNVRMIYYYFGNKAGLYAAVLEQTYGDMRRQEQTLALDAQDPVAAMRTLCGFVFDYHEAHPRYSRLVSIENIHEARHLARLEGIQALNRPILSALEGILSRGRAAGLFRADATAWDVHLLMTSFCFFRVANRHTLQAAFGRDTLSPRTRQAQRAMVADAVLGYARAAGSGDA